MLGKETRQLVDELHKALDLWLDRLERTITSMRSVNEYGAHSVQIPAAAAPNGQKATAVSNRLLGFSFRETSGTNPATVILRNGTDPSADLLVTISLAVAESARDWFGDAGIACTDGLYVDRVAGSVEGSVWLGLGGVS